MSSTITARVDAEKRRIAEEVFSQVGMTTQCATVDSQPERAWWRGGVWRLRNRTNEILFIDLRTWNQEIAAGSGLSDVGGEAMNTQVLPNDFIAAVNDIKLAILQARARAAQASNVEALKLYFFVGGYISKRTRTAKWGTGAINALSDRLQVELPGLRGFSPASIKYMRLGYEAWSLFFEIRHSASSGSRHLASDENNSGSERVLIRRLLVEEKNAEKKAAKKGRRK